MGDDIVISSIVIKSDTKDINFIKVIIGLTNGSMDMKIATYEITEELKEHIENKHRVCLPCKVIEKFWGSLARSQCPNDCGSFRIESGHYL